MKQTKSFNRIFLLVIFSAWIPLSSAQEFSQYNVVYFDEVGDTNTSDVLQECCDISKVAFSFDESNLYVAVAFTQPLTQDQHFAIAFDANQYGSNVSTPGSRNILSQYGVVFSTQDNPKRADVELYIAGQSRITTLLSVPADRGENQIVLTIPIDMLGLVSKRYVRMASIRYIEVAENIMSRVVWEVSPNNELPPIELFLPQPGLCIDSDGDGWGWRTFENGAGVSCVSNNIIKELEEAIYTSANCTDTDGDGWGWQQPLGTPGRSCRVPFIDPMPDETVYDGIACIDADGDGWGWQNPTGYPGRSCRLF